MFIINVNYIYLNYLFLLNKYCKEDFLNAKMGKGLKFWINFIIIK